MINAIRSIGLGTAALALASCGSIPDVSMPSMPSVFGGGDENDCPRLNAGSGPYSPPFPAECRTMNKTATGVRYIPITNGDINSGSPGPGATIVVNYEAFLAETGARIDSSYARGESSVYQVSELIDGWAEAVQLMNPGDEWLVYVPSAEAFGPAPLGDLIPGNSDLVYRVQLEGFISANDLADVAANTPPPPGPDMAAWAASFPWNPERPDAVTLPSGVSIVVLEKSDGDGPSPVPGDEVVVHYEGRVAETSTFFDSSWSTGEPAVFEAGTLVAGFNEALALMIPGDRYLVHIPADLAYGEEGWGEEIPPGADIMFQLELLGYKSRVGE
ncbi:MAG: FKBP-type peptidyl-prolyl cis-trans isomerase [Pseudomonadota bacterium]